jgi:photosystem II stability/assembly factor-like uncharacterized protein
MRIRTLRMLFVVGLLFGLASAARAQSMKLLEPNVGWLAAARNRVLWTTNGGLDWKNITPPAPRDAVISAIFFLDASRGWVLFAHGEPDVPGGLDFDLASTDSAGASWTVEPLRMPDRLSGSLIGGGASLAFADPKHGWLGLHGGLTPISQGYGSVLATSDGGKSWEYTPGTPSSVAGPVVMVTPQFGWLVGGQANGDLYVTRDGAKTWQRVVLESPQRTEQMKQYDKKLEQFQRSFGRDLPPSTAVAARKRMQEPQDHTYAAYDLPTFKDLTHGSICVTYPGVVVLFETDDGGVTWQPGRVLTGLQQHEMGARVVSAVADSTWFTGRVPKNGMPQLRKLGPGASATDNTMPAPETSGVSEMSFATPRQGWVLTFDGKLLSTNDGGASWTDITPARKLSATTP